MVALEAPWQNGMVERHGGVLGDIITVTVMESGATGFAQMKDVAIHSSMAKNRRPGKTGHSPRTMVFGTDERLVASGLNHYLEEPDDAAITAASSDAIYRKSMEIRKSALKAVIELDHSEKWAAAVNFPSRTEFPNFYLPGTQVFFYSAGVKKNRKGRQSRSTPGNWHGPAVVFGTEWDQGERK